MTTRKHLKRRVRTRAAQTGQSYATALRDIRREIEEKPMPAAPDSIADVIASCSFCGKSDRQVARIVAGPGVYICNECVALSATIMAEAAAPTPEDTERRRAEYRDRPAEEILALLPHVVKGAARMEAELAGWVSQLLAKGTDWSVIAAAIGISEDEARRRFDPSR